LPEEPTATNKPDELTATAFISVATPTPFIMAGVVQVEPLDEVAYIGKVEGPLYPTATNRPDEFTVTACGTATTLLLFILAGVVNPNNLRKKSPNPLAESDASLPIKGMVLLLLKLSLGG
jgi:hypothetical protein